MGTQVKDPVIAAGILAPNLVAVGENKQLLAVVGKGKTLDRQRRSRSGRHKQSGLHDDSALKGGEQVCYDSVAFNGIIAFAVLCPFYGKTTLSKDQPRKK